MEIQKTAPFIKWYRNLRDANAKAAVTRRIERMAGGNSGDVKPVGEGVSEARIDVGAGYRLYFTLRERTMVVLLCGGDKSTQAADIKAAKTMAKEI